MNAVETATRLADGGDLDRAGAEVLSDAFAGYPSTVLADWAGRWVALDEHDQVGRDAETLEDLMTILETDGVEGVSLMRAPVPGEPVVYGLG